MCVEIPGDLEGIGSFPPFFKEAGTGIMSSQVQKQSPGLFRGCREEQTFAEVGC